MDKTVFVVVAALGLAHGVASLFGLVQGLEVIIWLAIAAIAALWIGLGNFERRFVPGILAGIAVAVATGLVQGIFISKYLASNEVYAEAASALPISPGLYTLLMSPVLGTIYGLVIGAVAWVLGKIRK